MACIYSVRPITFFLENALIFFIYLLLFLLLLLLIYNLLYKLDYVQKKKKDSLIFFCILEHSNITVVVHDLSASNVLKDFRN